MNRDEYVAKVFDKVARTPNREAIGDILIVLLDEMFDLNERLLNIESSSTNKPPIENFGWEIIIRDEDPRYADIIFELDVGFEDKTLEQAMTHVKSVCDQENPIFVSCVRKAYENP